MSNAHDLTVSWVHRIRAMPARALAAFVDDATGMRARGQVDEDFGDWIEVALERLDELADDPNSPPAIAGCDCATCCFAMGG